MTILQRITREPAVLLGLVTATTGLLILLGVPLTLEAAGGILTFVGALVALLRQIVVPASEVEVQRKPGLPPVAGPASDLKSGTPVELDVVPAGVPSTHGGIAFEPSGASPPCVAPRGRPRLGPVGGTGRGRAG